MQKILSKNSLPLPNYRLKTKKNWPSFDW